MLKERKARVYAEREEGLESMLKERSARVYAEREKG